MSKQPLDDSQEGHDCINEDSLDVELPQKDEALIVIEDTEQQKPAAQRSQINVKSLASSDNEGDNDEAGSNSGMKSRKPTRSDLSVKVKKLRNKNKKQEQAIMEKA